MASRGLYLQSGRSCWESCSTGVMDKAVVCRERRGFTASSVQFFELSLLCHEKNGQGNSIWADLGWIDVKIGNFATPLSIFFGWDGLVHKKTDRSRAFIEPEPLIDLLESASLTYRAVAAEQTHSRTPAKHL
jgi:hypothetical protein